MNKDKFTSYLENQELLDISSTDQLEELVQVYPYCQSVRMLLVMNLFRNNSIRYDNELKTTAVYVNNRNVLRKHIESVNVDDGKVLFPDEDVSNESVSGEDKIDEAETPESIKDIGDTVEVGEEKSANSKHIEPETSGLSVEEEAENIAQLRAIVENHLNELEVANESRRQTEKQSETEEQYKKTEAKKKPDKTKSQIIEEFIKNEPSISRPRAEFYNPVSKAKQSVTDSQNIVSETLAKIFYDQGHLEKAIKIYQKLSLKFPEKSSYFAALIKKAEKELKS